MKTNKILSLMLVLVAVFAMTSCVQDDDYTVPNSLGNEENAGLESILAGIEAGDLTLMSIAEVKNQYVAGQVTEITSDVVVKGYVTSSDASGNFYKEFYMQDAPENPTAAIKVVLNQVDSYNQFNIGREVYISLKGLFVGETGDEIPAIGDEDGNEVTSISANQYPSHIFRSTTTETIIPLPLGLSGINESHVGMLVNFTDVQFAEDLAGESYVNADDDFDTRRTLQGCEGFGYTEFLLETSSFANFKQEPLPMGGGSVTAIVTKTFNGSDLVLALNSTDDVNLNAARCEPLDINDFNVVFEDSFDNGLNSWSTFNVIGAQVWGTTNFGNPAPSAYMNGFQSGAQNNEDWLISNAIDLSSVTNTIFFFETDKRYDGNDLEVYYSTDYSGGDPNSNGTWTQVDAIIDPNANSWNTWTNSGNIDISSADGQSSVYIAFKYTSSTSAAATFELDNVTVLGL